MLNLKEFESFYKDKRIFITGHTGFKGSWLSKILTEMGANVKGYSLEAPSSPSHISLLKIDMESIIGDIRDEQTLNREIKEFSPEIVFHLAAQPLVRYSYQNPVETYEINVIGTAKVLSACRNIENLKSFVSVTTDKCYENKEWEWPYRESDRLGGYDPYSNSKACAELVTSSFRNSFFNLNEYKRSHSCLIATARAGNVIGGGDWAEDRLVPDIVRGYTAGEEIHIRSPFAVRPWQHVLEPLSGYMLLAKALFEGNTDFASGWNFGPDSGNFQTVNQLIEQIKKVTPNINITQDLSNKLHEANTLKLDSSKASIHLDWSATWGFEETIARTMNWYSSFNNSGELLTSQDIQDFFN